MADVNVTFTGDDAEARRAIERLQREVAKLTGQLGDLNKKQGDVQQEAGKTAGGFEGVGRAAVGALAGLVSIQTAAGLIRDEFEAIARLRREALGQQVTTAQAQREFLGMYQPASAEEGAAIVETIRGISQRTGATETALYQAGVVVPSAAGNIPLEEAVKFLEAAARISPGDIKSTAAGMLDLANALGTSDPELAAGWFNALVKLVRVDTREAVASNLVPQLAGGQLVGAAPADSVAAMGALSNALADKSGAISATAFIQLASQLEKFLPEAEGFDARVQALQADQGLREQFFAEASFEQKARAAVEALLTEGSAIAQLYADKQAAIPDQAGLIAQAREQVAIVESIPAQQIETAQRQETATQQRFLVDALASGQAELVDQALTQALERGGFSAFTRTMADLDFESRVLTGESPIDAFRAALEQVRAGEIEGLTPEEIAARPETVQALDAIDAALRAVEALPGGPNGAPALVPAAGAEQQAAPLFDEQAAAAQQKVVDGLANLERLQGQQVEATRQQTAALLQLGRGLATGNMNANV